MPALFLLVVLIILAVLAVVLAGRALFVRASELAAVWLYLAIILFLLLRLGVH